MATSKKKPKTQPANGQKITTIRSPDFRVIYSNSLTLSSSPVEARLTFTHITDSIGQADGMVNEEEICICINPSIMKLMLTQMEALLTNHENLWGKIELPFGIQNSDIEVTTNESKNK